MLSPRAHLLLGSTLLAAGALAFTLLVRLAPIGRNPDSLLGEFLARILHARDHPVLHPFGDIATHPTALVSGPGGALQIRDLADAAASASAAPTTSAPPLPAHHAPSAAPARGDTPRPDAYYPPPMSRGVLYIVWNRTPGSPHERALQRSIRSLRKHHPELTYHVADLPPTSSLLDKARMFSLSPFEETLYLDTDTIVMGRLDFGFDRAARHHVACAICEAPFASRYRESITGDVIEYNTGVVFFSKSDPARALFDAWRRLAPVTDSSVIYLNPDGTQGKMPVNDQASFAKAVHELNFNPFVLPENWNFRPHFMHDFFGPLKVWHAYADPPQGLEEFNDQINPKGVMGFSRIG